MAHAQIAPGGHGRVQATRLKNDGIRLLIRWRPLDGSAPRQVTATGVSKAAAERALNRNITKAQATLDATAAEREAQTREERSLTTLIHECFDELKSIGDIRPQTLSEYERMARFRIEPVVGHWQIAKVTAREVSSFLSEVREEVPGSYNTIRTVLTQAFSLAVRNGDCVANPLREIRRPRKKRKLPTIVTPAEVTRLREALTGLAENPPTRAGPRSRYADVRDLLDFQLATGTRIGEALALTWDDVELDGTLPHVSITGGVVFLKGRGHFIQPLTKTHKSRRGICLPEWEVEILRARRDRAKGPLVFPSRAGTVWSPANARTLLRTVRGKAGLPKLTPHTMRRTYGTAVERAFDMHTASEALGHSDEAVTRNAYVRPAELGPDVRSALDELSPKLPDISGNSASKDEVN